ncbi:helix-turn-helix domain-containing protein [Aeromicrobium sp. HA]|uniref:helix-turn-helix domain-containing protein n=1 Tax=Aeromicrobium sp. HA TaxID=3009077 RepID=UPI0022AFD613|nr:helix-turn-helix transcriptional regulator [Aeromicrobium sp. HA]
MSVEEPAWKPGDEALIRVRVESVQSSRRVGGGVVGPEEWSAAVIPVNGPGYETFVPVGELLVPGRSEAETLRECMASAVREGLARAGVSQADAAAYLNVSQKHLSQMLTGKVDGSLSMWQRLLEFVDVDAGLLVDGRPVTEATTEWGLMTEVGAVSWFRKREHALDWFEPGYSLVCRRVGPVTPADTTDTEGTD